MEFDQIKVLFIKHRWDVPYICEVAGVKNIMTRVAQFDPDVIVTSGNLVPACLKTTGLELRKRWIHVEETDSDEQVANAIKACYVGNFWRQHPGDDITPLVSVYTATYNTGDVLDETYWSLKEQTYQNWEWVVVDDGSDDGTWDRLLYLANHDWRVKPIRLKHNGRIGFTKDTATRLANGSILVELDHDDILTDNALEKIVETFKSDKEIGMVYSNFAEFYADGTPHQYTGDFWKNRYRDTIYHGRLYKEAIAPEVNEIVNGYPAVWNLTTGPNHVRAYRTDVLRKLGGYNKNMPVADDWDLYIRFYLHSKCYHINELLYLYRFHDDYANTTFTRNVSIQAHLRVAQEHYHSKMMAHKRVKQTPNNNLCVVALTYNERNAIEGYFDQFKHWTTNFAILDSGSTDGTIEWAEQNGVTVYRREFDRFDNQRNALLSFVKDYEWVVMLDPDERLAGSVLDTDLSSLYNSGYDIFLCPLYARYADGSSKEWVAKPFLFRNDGQIKWIYPVHEKLIGSHKQAMIVNSHINHIIPLHDKQRRSWAEKLYSELSHKEHQKVNAYPILTYSTRDDERIKKIEVGPAVSVIIPTYARLMLLERAVKSVLEQKYISYEIIIVGDNCPQLSDFAITDGRIRVLNLNNRSADGGATPRNHAIKHVRYDWIAYLDDDNMWEPDHLSSLMEAITRTNSMFGFSDMKCLGKTMVCRMEKGEIDTSCVVHHKSLIEKYGLWKPRDEVGYAHDWELFSRWLSEKHCRSGKATLIYNADTSGQCDYLVEKMGEIK